MGAKTAYADLRASCEKRGVSLTPFDVMIAAQAIALDATLVTRDKAFGRVEGPLRIDDWITPLSPNRTTAIQPLPALRPARADERCGRFPYRRCGTLAARRLAGR